MYPCSVCFVHVCVTGCPGARTCSDDGTMRACKDVPFLYERQAGRQAGRQVMFHSSHAKHTHVHEHTNAHGRQLLGEVRGAMRAMYAYGAVYVRCVSV